MEKIFTVQWSTRSIIHLESLKTRRFASVTCLAKIFARSSVKTLPAARKVSTMEILWKFQFQADEVSEEGHEVPKNQNGSDSTSVFRGNVRNKGFRRGPRYHRGEYSKLSSRPPKKFHRRDVFSTLRLHR